MEFHIYSNVLLVVYFLLFSYAALRADARADSKSLLETGKPLRALTSAWAGQRGGRRLKRNLKEEMGNANKEQLSDMMELIQDNPWAVMAMNEGKRHAPIFTPRLGRESGEEGGQSAGSDRWLQDPDILLSTGDLMAQRSPPFAPRLGRRTVSSYAHYPAYI